ncbi:hypothetical protein PUW24_19775 [Paenibacillus urinalis]|uniref:EamA domain-containing protein n=1 Tax=Paenibacillus urinalis TaxID=521520 RepID=A0ABY7XFX4_9BACL|nr:MULTISPECIES: hypothetical protein [Paenibacillus]WDH96392.1 hypothetical protein PUW24_19775 [Paenibacillus urinalis]WDI04614.1 hypothetical protein PUW25_11935 [Paenibacillus urinalis]GAK40519.1 hypothetical protein TCA2_3009 [Paenibacillus sp. TCA20]
MKIVDLYTSEVNVDTIAFSIFFIVFVMGNAIVVSKLIKLSEQYVSRLRYIIGLILLYAGGAAGFELVMKYLPRIGQAVPGPGAGMILIGIGIAVILTAVFIIVAKYVYRFNKLLNPTVLFIAVQPVLFLLFLAMFVVSDKLSLLPL